jgi:hypothetical protein
MTETWLPGPDAHEHQFVEEQEPSGRLILAPCLVCGLTGGDAIATASERLRQINGFIDMVDESTVIDQPDLAWVSEWLTLILDGASLQDIAGIGRSDGS